MNRIVIGGVSIEVEGSNVRVIGGSIYVDDCPVASGLSRKVHIHWHGNLANLDADGSVECQNVRGNVTAGGSVHCGEVSGCVTAGGSVHGRGREIAAHVGNHIVAGGSVHIH